ncbi:MAG: hypothetical protein OSB07_11000 [Dehalococcoidia bacterium]|nr:hypothetical protein [Dehalococcoidia bacterium]
MDKPPSTRPSNALLHVFVGTATVNGRTVPDGTLVAVYVTGAKSSTLTIDATAFDKSRQSGKASLELTISATPVAAGEAEVVDGSFNRGNGRNGCRGRRTSCNKRCSHQ